MVDLIPHRTPQSLLGWIWDPKALPLGPALILHMQFRLSEPRHAMFESGLCPLLAHIRLQASMSGHQSQDPHSPLQADARFPWDSLWWKNFPPGLLWGKVTGPALAVCGGSSGHTHGRHQLRKGRAPFLLPVHSPPFMPLGFFKELSPYLELGTSFSPTEPGRPPPVCLHPTWHNHCGYTRERGPQQ